MNDAEVEAMQTETCGIMIDDFPSTNPELASGYVPSTALVPREPASRHNNSYQIEVLRLDILESLK